MSITIAKPPVQASGIDMEDAVEIAQAIADLAPGEFVMTGETFSPKMEKRKNKKGETVEVDAGRAAANATAHKYMRVIESRYDVTLRSRTWQNADGMWVFGIRAKDEEGDAAPE